MYWQVQGVTVSSVSVWRSAEVRVAHGERGLADT